MVLLRCIVHIDVLHLFWNAAKCNDTRASYSSDFTVTVLFDLDAVLWVFHSSTGKLLPLPDMVHLIVVRVELIYGLLIG